MASAAGLCWNPAGGTLGEARLAPALAQSAPSAVPTGPIPGGARLAFVDPALVGPGTPQSAHPLHAELTEDLAAYRSRWGALPATKVAEGPALTTGAAGERVRSLAVRLGVASAGASGRFDAALAAALREFQAAHGLGATGTADAATIRALNRGPEHYERLILANLERLRVLPPPRSGRFILVNVAAGRLWMYDAGQATGTMRVVVGKLEQQTPMMAGLIRYAVFNPYWNVPEDLARDAWAPRVMKNGVGYFQAQRMQALSDWSDDAKELDPRAVDWAAVAAGKVSLRIRQRPGAGNMMGKVKFMLPNQLGIYLHDTPNKAAFQANPRLLSSGCVRLEDADALSRWLLGPAAPDSAALGPDQHVDLPEPIPVYITYLTAAPGPQGVSFHPDVYRRDAALVAQLQLEPRATG